MSWAEARSVFHRATEVAVFKKALQVVTTFGVLLAAYAGYVRAFAVVADLLAQAGRQSPHHWPRQASKTEIEATELAVRAFGRGHWTTDKDLSVRYYNKERGYWM